MTGTESIRVALAGLALVALSGAAEAATLYVPEGVARLEREAAPNLLTALYPAHRVALEPTADYGETLERVAADRDGLGFVTRDAYVRYSGRYPAAAQRLELHGRITEECVFVAVHKDGPLRSYSDLKSEVKGENAVLSLGPGDGRPAEVFAQFTLLDPELKRLRTDDRSGLRALSFVAGGRSEAALFVAPPDPEHPLVKAVAETPQLTFLPLPSDGLVGGQAGLPPAFDPRQVTFTKPGLFGGGRSVATLCTPLAVVVNTAADRRLIEAVVKASVDGRILPQPKGWRERARGFVDYVVFQVNVLMSFF
ncbi:MAG: hypothetical protein OHK0024_18390 [Thalassobaculales bacterium]